MTTFFRCTSVSKTEILFFKISRTKSLSKLRTLSKVFSFFEENCCVCKPIKASSIFVKQSSISKSTGASISRGRVQHLYLQCWDFLYFYHLLLTNFVIYCFFLRHLCFVDHESPCFRCSLENIFISILPLYNINSSFLIIPERSFLNLSASSLSFDFDILPKIFSNVNLFLLTHLIWLMQP